MGLLYSSRRALLDDGAFSYTDKMKSYDPFAYWTLGDAVGPTAVDEINSPLQDGTYVGATLGQPGIGDGGTSIYLDGINDLVNLFSATLAAAFDPTLGTFLFWAKIEAATWLDGTTDYWASLRANAVEYHYVRKDAGNNAMRYLGAANGVAGWLRLVGGYSPIIFVQYAFTWDQGIPDQVLFYINAVQSGPAMTPIGAWTGPLATAAIGSFDGATPSGKGFFAHAVLFDKVLTQPQLADLLVIP